MKKEIVRFGNRLTRLGEKKGWPILIYNPIVWGAFFFNARKSGRHLAEVVKVLFPEVRSIFDMGAGTGGYVRMFRNAGLESDGAEYARGGRILARLQGVNLEVLDCSLPERETCRKYDLVISIEVGEHLPAELACEFVKRICRRGELVIFTAAHPGQGGHGHINEQPKAYWVEHFNRQGYERLETMETRIIGELQRRAYRGWLSENLLVFRRTTN